RRVGDSPLHRTSVKYNSDGLRDSGSGAMASNRTLTAIRGVRVGHAQDRRRRTGTTVVLLDPPAMAFADARGGWPGTYDTAASDLGKTFIDRHALLLTGGDVYGFDAVGGIRRFLLEKKLASPTVGGTRDTGGKGFLEMEDVLEDYVKRSTTRFGTTIGTVGTDAPLDHEQLARLVELAHDGIALAVRPAHMSTDGDTILGFATRKADRQRLDYRAFDALHHVAVREVAKSAVYGVLSASPLGGVLGFEDL